MSNEIKTLKNSEIAGDYLSDHDFLFLFLDFVGIFFSSLDEVSNGTHNWRRVPLILFDFFSSPHSFLFYQIFDDFFLCQGWDRVSIPFFLTPIKIYECLSKEIFVPKTITPWVKIREL